MDILYALRYGEPVLFFRDHIPRSIRLSFSPSPTSGLHQHDGMDTDLKAILIDVMSLTNLFNNPCNRQSLDIGTFLEIVISICCRLIRFGPLRNPKPGCNRDAAYHIGLLTFMTTLFLNWDNRRIQEYHLISWRLREVLDEDFDAHDGDLHLWLLFISSLWSSTTNSHWLILRIRSLTAQLNIDSWSGVRDFICKLPWVNALHEQTGRAVWDLVHQRGHE